MTYLDNSWRLCQTPRQSNKIRFNPINHCSQVNCQLASLILFTYIHHHNKIKNIFSNKKLMTLRIGHL